LESQLSGNSRKLFPCPFTDFVPDQLGYGDTQPGKFLSLCSLCSPLKYISFSFTEPTIFSVSGGIYKRRNLKKKSCVALGTRMSIFLGGHRAHAHVAASWNGRVLLFIRRPSCAEAHVADPKWTFFVFHFRRRRRKSLDLVLLGSRGQQTQLHMRLSERQWHCCYNKRLQVSTRAVEIQMEPLPIKRWKI